MIRTETFVNKIRAIGYTYKDQQKRTRMWKKQGGTHRLFVPMCDLLEEEFVRSSLLQCGETKESIEQFISDHSISKTSN